jgi:amino acid transporter
MQAEPTLRRALSLPVITLYGLGTIIGTGIYVLVGQVAGMAGMHAPIAFVLAGIVAGFTAFSYAELASRYPRSAGEAVYLEEGYGVRALSVIVGLTLAVAGMVSAAAIANGFVGYLHLFAHVPRWAAVGSLVMTLGIVAAWGIRESALLATVTTLAELGGLIVIVVAAGSQVADLTAQLPRLVPTMDPAAASGIVTGAFLAFYAFLGFEDMVNVAEEVRDPAKTMPVAILLAAGGATVLYVTVAAVAVLTVPPEALAESAAPLAEVYERATGSAPWFIGVVGLFAVVNGALIQIIMGARILYGMSSEGWLPRMFRYVHPRRQTPLVTTLIMTFAVLVLALAFPLTTLAGITSFMLLAVFATVNLALVRIKLRGPAPPGVRAFPLWVPVAGFLLTLGILAAQVFA